MSAVFRHVPLRGMGVVAAAAFLWDPVAASGQCPTKIPWEVTRQIKNPDIRGVTESKVIDQAFITQNGGAQAMLGGINAQLTDLDARIQEARKCIADSTQGDPRFVQPNLGTVNGSCATALAALQDARLATQAYVPILQCWARQPNAGGVAGGGNKPGSTESKSGPTFFGAPLPTSSSGSSGSGFQMPTFGGAVDRRAGLDRGDPTDASDVADDARGLVATADSSAGSPSVGRRDGGGGLLDAVLSADPGAPALRRPLGFRAAFPPPPTDQRTALDAMSRAQFLKLVDGELAPSGAGWEFAVSLSNIDNLRAGNNRCASVELRLDVTLQTPPYAAESHQIAFVRFEAPDGVVRNFREQFRLTRAGEPTAVTVAGVDVRSCGGAAPIAAGQCTPTTSRARDELSDIAAVLIKQRDGYWRAVSDLQSELAFLDSREMREATSLTNGILAHVSTLGAEAEVVLMFTGVPTGLKTVGGRLATLKTMIEVAKDEVAALEYIRNGEGNVLDFLLDIASLAPEKYKRFRTAVEQFKNAKFFRDQIVDGTSVGQFYQLKIALIESADVLRPELGKMQDRLNAAQSRLDAIMSSLAPLQGC